MDIDKRYKQLLAEKYLLIDSEYISRLYRYNEWHYFKDAKSLFEGRIISVTDDGRLQIEDRKKRFIKYAFKEVEFI